MEPEALKRRYRSLWIGEATAIVVFVASFLVYALPDADWPNWIARTYSLMVIIVILVQGIVWWRWKLRILQAGERMMPLSVLRWFRRFRSVNWLLIALFPLVLWLKWQWTGLPLMNRDSWWGLLFLVGAILEQINYYYVQLMYDSAYDWNYLRTHRRLRPGSIGKSLARVQ